MKPRFPVTVVTALLLATGCSPSPTGSDEQGSVPEADLAVFSIELPTPVAGTAPTLPGMLPSADMHPAPYAYLLDLSAVPSAADRLASELDLVLVSTAAGRRSYATSAASEAPVAELSVEPDGSWYFYQDTGGFWFECAAGQGGDGCMMLDEQVSPEEAAEAAGVWFDSLGVPNGLTVVETNTDFGAYSLARLTVPPAPGSQDAAGSDGPSMLSDVTFGVGFAPTPSGLQVAYAYGTFAVPVLSGGPLTLVGADEAAVRSTSWSGGWAAADGSGQVEVSSAVPQLLYFEDVSGVLWLLPGWLYTTAGDAGDFVALAVDDSHLDLVLPPIRTRPPSGSPAGDPAGDLSMEPGEDAVRLSRDVIGMSEEDAGRTISAEGLPWRVMARDDEQLVGTTDFSPSRLNLTVVNGLVTAVEFG